ncbi:MAG: hypothetical protein Q4D30_01175 [Bacteroidales bacterium]|nr:hypothetical protein [Bacteroidales bacterium]
MRALLVTMVFTVSLVLMCMAAALGSWVMAALCFACMVASCDYMERHKKSLLAEIDSVFGRDSDLE